MKKTIILGLVFFYITSTFAQTDSFWVNNYEQKIIENSKLKNDLQTEKQKFHELSDAYKKDTLTLRKQINDLRNDLSSEKQKVLDLNKSKIKEERDNLKTNVDSLVNVILKQNQIINEKDRQIINEKANAKTTADSAKNDGRAEVLASILNFYKNLSFNDLIKYSTKESVARDMQLVGNNQEVKSVLNDLQTYFNAMELLSVKFDTAQIKNAYMKLSQIKRQSKLLGELKDNIETYRDYNTDLKEAISKLINLDSLNSALDNAEAQKLKFNSVLFILSDYFYNYYDYPKYSYLSVIVLEIIKRKKPNPDAEITDLLIKL